MVSLHFVGQSQSESQQMGWLVRRRCVACCCIGAATRFPMLLCCAAEGRAGSTICFQDANSASVGGNAVMAWLCMHAEASGVGGTGWLPSCLGSGAGQAAGGPACAVMSKLTWCPGRVGFSAGASSDREASLCFFLQHCASR